MVNKCWLCKETCERYSKYTFHRFPRNEKLRLLWLEKINKQNCILPKSATLCSKHFKSKDYNPNVVGKIRLLKKDAFPFINADIQPKQEAIFNEIMPECRRFPVDPGRRNQWIKALNRANFVPGKHASLCSKHFEDKHYFIKKNKRLLRKDAIPTIFNSEDVSSKISVSNSSNVVSVSKLRALLNKKMTAFAAETVSESSTSISNDISSFPVPQFLIKSHKFDDLSSAMSSKPMTETYAAIPTLFLKSNSVNPSAIKREERNARRNSKKLVSELLKQAPGSVTQNYKNLKPRIRGSAYVYNTSQFPQNTFLNDQVIPSQISTKGQFSKTPFAVRCSCNQTPESSNIDLISGQIKLEFKSEETETQFESKDTEQNQRIMQAENIVKNEQENIRIKKEIDDIEDNAYNLEEVYIIGSPVPNDNNEEENVVIKTEPMHIEENYNNLEVLVKQEHDEIDIKEEPLFP